MGDRHGSAPPRNRRSGTERHYPCRPDAPRRPQGDPALVRRRRQRDRRVHPRGRQGGAGCGRHVLHPHPRQAGTARRVEAVPRRPLRHRPGSRADHRAGRDHARHHRRRADGAEHGRSRDHRRPGLAQHREHVPGDRRRGDVCEPAADGSRMAARSRRHPRRAATPHPLALRQHPLQPDRLGDAARAAGRAAGALPGAQHPADRRRGLPSLRLRGRRRAFVHDAGARRRSGGGRERVLEGLGHDRVAHRLGGGAEPARRDLGGPLRVLQHRGDRVRAAGRDHGAGAGRGDGRPAAQSVRKGAWRS